ncbi:hypothetical protein M409DRAFT_59011 [Zasmidium cellare ATCC 36951]|uniref:NADH:flavin oxidoreductase/NADH oxidase N-terminal domain-containing protein n=1 Tax=Zasmidium cellare ATCC 36951 TaxID=1080233 RepID=A0A6A6C881_ZASCE|nr:uncharacterized protein M409DRAFT_59011 [Zasmidium cellare ATCC 36951]KAF2161626.1 hypothetical protein M409DRAFT_59011 [Zasmidium cellare ATCC 36951]
MSTSPRFPKLAEPLEVGSVLLKNRVVMSSLTRNRSRPTNVLTEASELYYEQRSWSLGLILTEGTLVYQQGTEWPYAPGIWSEEQTQAWKRIVNRVHDRAGKIYCQLWSVGRVAHPDMPEQIASKEPVWTSSTISARGGKFRNLPGRPGYVAGKAVPDPRVLVERFVQGAKNAKVAGFDGVEIHAANGYLITQFLDSTANNRTDEWGGSVENRLRFALEVFDGISQVYPPGCIGIKLNPTGGYNDVGMSLEDTLETYGELIRALVARGTGYIQLVRYLDFFEMIVDGKKRSTNMDVWENFTPLIRNSNTRILLNGNITPEEAEQLLESGVGDAVVIGRPLINNPDYYQRIQRGIPLSPLSATDPKTWYVSSTEPVAKYGNLPDPHIGMTDYPFSVEV